MRQPTLEKFFSSFFEEYSSPLPVIVRHKPMSGIATSLRQSLPDAEYLSPSCFPDGFSQYPLRGGMICCRWSAAITSTSQLIISDIGANPEHRLNFNSMINDVITQHFLRCETNIEGFESIKSEQDKRLIILTSTETELPSSIENLAHIIDPFVQH